MPQSIETAIAILKSSSEGALATLENGAPFVSAISFIYHSEDPKKLGRLHLLMSDLARHTKNIQKNPEVSVLVTETGDAPIYEKKRVTIQGSICRLKEPSTMEKFKKEYILRFPKNENLFSFADFHSYEIGIESAYVIGGFGNIQTIK